MKKFVFSLVVVIFVSIMGYFGYAFMAEVQAANNLKAAQKIAKEEIEKTCQAMDSRQAYACQEVAKNYLSDFEEGSLDHELKIAEENPTSFNGIAGRISTRVLETVNEILIQRGEPSGLDQAHEWIRKNDPRFNKLLTAHKLRTETFRLRDEIETAASIEQVNRILIQAENYQDSHDDLLDQILE